MRLTTVKDGNNKEKYRLDFFHTELQDKLLETKVAPKVQAAFAKGELALPVICLKWNCVKSAVKPSQEEPGWGMTLGPCLATQSHVSNITMKYYKHNLMQGLTLDSNLGSQSFVTCAKWSILQSNQLF